MQSAFFSSQNQKRDRYQWRLFINANEICVLFLPKSSLFELWSVRRCGTSSASSSQITRSVQIDPHDRSRSIHTIDPDRSTRSIQIDPRDRSRSIHTIDPDRSTLPIELIGGFIRMQSERKIYYRVCSFIELLQKVVHKSSS